MTAVAPPWSLRRDDWPIRAVQNHTTPESSRSDHTVLCEMPMTFPRDSAHPVSSGPAPGVEEGVVSDRFPVLRQALRDDDSMAARVEIGRAACRGGAQWSGAGVAADGEAR